MIDFQSILNKIDNRITGKCYSRPQYQAQLIIDKLFKISRNKLDVAVDIGGGFNPQYKQLIQTISNRYLNVEIKNGPGVDIVGEASKIPLRNCSVDLVSMFMVLEHLSEPYIALSECSRILKNKSFLTLTTVQYWHKHDHPNDYYRYTKNGLIYLLKKSGFQIKKIWSIGGPFLVLFHVIELNLPNTMRTIFSIFFYRIFDWLDDQIFLHNDKRSTSDSVGWSVIAQKI